MLWNWPEQERVAPPLPRTLRWCRVCNKQTAHELREGAGVVATICVPCLERELNYELDRD